MLRMFSYVFRWQRQEVEVSVTVEILKLGRLVRAVRNTLLQTAAETTRWVWQSQSTEVEGDLFWVQLWVKILTMSWIFRCFQFKWTCISESSFPQQRFAPSCSCLTPCHLFSRILLLSCLLTWFPGHTASSSSSWSMLWTCWPGRRRISFLQAWSHRTRTQ